jgi:TRAP-type C4-dicarboxylate transport system permease small subunit
MITENRPANTGLPSPPPAVEPVSLATEAEPVTKVPLKIEDWATVIVMALLALITFANVLVRYFTNHSFAWTEEISIFLMIVLVLVAASAAVARNRHIRIEYFAEKGTPGRQRFLARAGSLVVFAVFILLAVLSSRMVWDDYRFGETSPGIGVPQWWYSVWLPLLSMAIALRAWGLFVRQGRHQ